MKLTLHSVNQMVLSSEDPKLIWVKEKQKGKTTRVFKNDEEENRRFRGEAE